MKVFVDSACDIKYASFYIYGLRQVFGRRNVQFDSSRFEHFPHNNFYLPIVIEAGNAIHKIIIDFADWPTIKPEPYDWCDLYCKINITFEDAGLPKLFSIGPGFGIRVFSAVETIGYALANYLKSGKRIVKKRRFLYDFYGQYKRPSIDDYAPVKPMRDYVFFASSLWKNDTTTNAFRANFMRACQQIDGLHFEGGFAPRAKNDIPGYEPLTLGKRIGTAEYISKTKKSLAAFNTPAVAQCHGWKLGEFLAMGMAIISTPISRVLPEELRDRHHILLTDGSQEDISQKITQLMKDEKLRDFLCAESRAYYERNLSPEAVVRSILERLNVDAGRQVR